MSKKAELMKAQIREARLHSHISGMYGALGNTELQQLYGNKSKDLQEKVGEALDQGFGGLQVSPIELKFKPVSSNEFVQMFFRAADEPEAGKPDVEVEVEADVEVEEVVEIEVEDEPERVTADDIRNSAPGSTFKDCAGDDWERTGEGVAVHYGDGISGAIDLWDDRWTRSDAAPRGNYAAAEVIDEPEVELGDLKRGDKIRVFEENRYGSTRTSEAGVEYERDGMGEGDAPWCRTPRAGKTETLAYLNSGDIVRWELVSRKADEPVEDEPTGPDVKLVDLGEGAVIRVFEENRHGDTRTSEEGVIFDHDGEDRLYWVAREGTDSMASLLENKDIIRWELLSR